MDETCASILDKHMKAGSLVEAPLFPDIQRIRADDLSKLRPEIITAGFPCQEVSVVGKGYGVHGERSGLVFDLIGMVGRLRTVQVVLLENSPFIVTRGLHDITGAFSRAGFRCVWGFFHASQVGALHNRKRWYCLAYKDASVLKDVPESRRGKSKSWKEPQLTARLVPNDNGPGHLRNMRRLAALGNAVVPQCAFEALCVLSEHARAGLSGQIEIPSAPEWARTIYMSNDPPRGFGTPTKTHWTQNRSLNFRMQKTMLSNQLYWDKATWDTFGRRRGAPAEQKYMSIAYDINPAWVERFMGYPTGWTRY